MVRIPLLIKRIMAKKPRRAEKRRTFDEDRIQREVNYQHRLNAPNSRLLRLQGRVKSQKRRSYGR